MAKIFNFRRLERFSVAGGSQVTRRYGKTVIVKGWDVKLESTVLLKDDAESGPCFDVEK
jgi:hypothetical protein